MAFKSRLKCLFLKPIFCILFATFLHFARNTTLGHDFVEISLKKSKTTIEVKAKNDSGVTTIKKSEIKKPILKNSFLKQLWTWICRIFKL